MSFTDAEYAEAFGRSPRPSRPRCPAINIGPLKAHGLICRCRRKLAPGQTLCDMHQRRLDDGREVVTAPWTDPEALQALEQAARRIVVGRPLLTKAYDHLMDWPAAKRWGLA